MIGLRNFDINFNPESVCTSSFYWNKCSSNNIHGILTAAFKNISWFLESASFVKVTKQNKDICAQWTRNYLNWSDEWVRVLVSEENQLNLDGPDGCEYYWQDFQKKILSFSRQLREVSLFLCAAFSYDGTTHISFFELSKIFRWLSVKGLKYSYFHLESY